jgi:two-component system, NarL family, response regulator NreC
MFPAPKIRCVLALDHVLFRQGLRRLLEDEPDIDVVSEGGNAAECLRKVYEFQPDVVVADAGAFGLPAPDAELCVARESPETKMVFLSVQEESGLPSEWHAVAADCAARQTSVEELVERIRTSCGRNRTNPDDGVMECGTRHRVETMMSVERALTAREREVLKLLAEGKTVRTAAIALGLSSKTVDAHKFNLMRKLGIHNKAELVMWAIQKNVVKVPVNF